MVAITDDAGGCDKCERCQFIERLSNYLKMAASDGPEEWASDACPMIEQMHVATAALQRLWLGHYGEAPRDPDDATIAAVALVELNEFVAQLESRLRQ